MYKIYIDTSDRYIKTVTLLKNNVQTDVKSGDVDVATAVKELLAEHKVQLEEVEEFDVNKGPGSFTGLKMGVTFVNVTNWATGKKSLNELVLPDYGREPNITLRD